MGPDFIRPGTTQEQEQSHLETRQDCRAHPQEPDRQVSFIGFISSYLVDYAVGMPQQTYKAKHNKLCTIAAQSSSMVPSAQLYRNVPAGFTARYLRTSSFYFWISIKVIRQRPRLPILLGTGRASTISSLYTSSMRLASIPNRAALVFCADLLLGLCNVTQRLSHVRTPTKVLSVKEKPTIPA